MLRLTRCLWTVWAFLWACSWSAAAPPSSGALEHFEKKVRPLLAAKCWQCNGAEKQKGGLRLDSAAAAAKGGDLGPVIVPGQPDESLLIQAVRQTGDLKMPPKDKLAEREIADLVMWVKNGAVWPSDRTAATTSTS